MSELYYTTIDGTNSGRASHYFRNEGSAKSVLEKQNGRAESLEIKTRYQLATRDDEGVDSKEIRD